MKGAVSSEPVLPAADGTEYGSGGIGGAGIGLLGAGFHGRSSAAEEGVGAPFLGHDGWRGETARGAGFAHLGPAIMHVPAIRLHLGGEAQIVVLLRAMQLNPSLLLLDEPTRGIDVAAKADIYALLDELTASGLGILLISSELSELLALSDRVLVMHRGRVVAEFPRAGATQEKILCAAMGG